MSTKAKKKRSKPINPGKLIPGKAIYTCSEAAKVLGLSSQRMRRLLHGGRVAYAQQLNGAWAIPPESIEFVRAYFPRRARTAGGQSQQRAERMRQAAAKLDKRCKELQAEALP